MMKIFKGSTLTLSNGLEITFEQDSKISFPNSASEATQIGFLQTTRNYEQAEVQKNNELRANKEQFKFRRDPNGNLLTLEEQVEDGQTVDEFILKLNKTDAEYLGVYERQTALKEAAAEAKKQAAAEKAAETAKK